MRSYLVLECLISFFFLSPPKKKKTSSILKEPTSDTFCKFRDRKSRKIFAQFSLLLLYKYRSNARTYVHTSTKSNFWQSVGNTSTFWQTDRQTSVRSFGSVDFILYISSKCQEKTKLIRAPKPGGSGVKFPAPVQKVMRSNLISVSGLFLAQSVGHNL